LLVVLAGMAPLASGASAPPALPQWSEADQELLKDGMLVPGSGLLGDQSLVTEQGTPPPAPSLSVELPPQDDPTVVDSGIPEEHLADYFDTRPTSFLLDPQKLLSRQEQRDRVGFLRYHSEDSAVDLYLYLFDGPQEIPGEVRAEELVERMFGEGKPAAVVFYFLGAPQKAELRLSPSLAETVSVAERQRALQSSVAEALEKADPVDQLERFTVQLSIRLYWVEKAFGDGGPAIGPLVVLADKPAKVPARNRWQPWLAKARSWALPAAVLGGAAAAGRRVSWGHGARARHRFPEIEVVPRLGGAHGAGVGAVITFGSAVLPPSVQREQVPDYLRRA
jgi:hypothetical protein